MKKLLLAATALIGVSALSNPARAEMALNLGGYFSGYGVFSNNNLTDTRELDLRRDTEVHVSGETTLDNGLTVGFHTEQALGGATLTDEAYAYFSGSWGRVNLGSEDGAAYLLQVAAPSADSNIDGLRTYIQAITPAVSQTAYYVHWDTIANEEARAGEFTDLTGFGGGSVLDYDHTSDPGTNATDRLTYLSPKIGGIQAGLSYAPQDGQNGVGDALSAIGSHTPKKTVGGVGAPFAGVGETRYQDIWEVGARWDGSLQGVGLSFGGGYSSADLESHVTLTGQGQYGPHSGTQTWNAGFNLMWHDLSLGAGYLDTAMGVTAMTSVGPGPVLTIHTGEVVRKTWVSGLGWDREVYHAGLSYLHQETEFPSFGGRNNNGSDMFFVGNTNSVDKWTLGGGYAFAPGMTLNSSLALGEFKSGGATFSAGVRSEEPDNRFTQVAIGTQIAF